MYDDEKQPFGKGGEQYFHCRMKLETLQDLKFLALSDKKNQKRTVLPLDAAAKALVCTLCDLCGKCTGD